MLIVLFLDCLAFPFIKVVNGDVVEAAIMSLNESNGITCQLVNTHHELDTLMESLQLCCQGKSCNFIVELSISDII